MVMDSQDRVFGALADATRRTILVRLLDGPEAVEPLAARFEISRPAVSKHLKVLSRAGLVRSRREGRLNVYALEPGPLETVRAWLDAFWRDRLSVLKRLAEGDS
jgi:DNA-binding transcriptional ArsR family regulator